MLNFLHTCLFLSKLLPPLEDCRVSSPQPAQKLPPPTLNIGEEVDQAAPFTCSHRHTGQREGAGQGRQSHPENAHLFILIDREAFM